MEENVFIIHPSEIIRKGLAMILQEYFSMEITQLGAASDLSSFSEIHHMQLIIIMDEDCVLPEELEKKLRKNNQVIIIGFLGYDRRLASHRRFEFEIRERFSASDPAGDSGSAEIGRKQRNTMPVNGDLTTRETDVIRLIAMGYANKEIADRLNISIHTVISHRKNITEKLNIKSISGLTVYAIMNNMIDIKDIDPEELI